MSRYIKDNCSSLIANEMENIIKIAQAKEPLETYYLLQEAEKTDALSGTNSGKKIVDYINYINTSSQSVISPQEVKDPKKETTSKPEVPTIRDFENIVRGWMKMTPTRVDSFIYVNVIRLMQLAKLYGVFVTSAASPVNITQWINQIRATIK